MSTNSFSRRHFLKTASHLALAGVALPTLIPASALGKAGKASPNQRVVLGCIGVGPQGQGDMRNFLNQKDCQVVAVCDVKADQLTLARNTVNKAYQNDDCAT